MKNMIATVKTNVISAEIPTTADELETMLETNDHNATLATLELLARAQKENRPIKYTV